MSRGVSIKTNNANADKPKEFRTSIMKLIRYCKPFFPIIAIALICASVSSIFTIMGPDKLSKLTDLVTQGIKSTIDMDAIFHIGFFLLTIYAAGAILNFIQGIIMTNTTQKISKKLRDDISKKINILPVGYYHNTSFGDVLSRVTNDVDSIGETLQRSIAQLVSAITLLLGAIFMMLKTNIVLTITAIVTSSLGFLLMKYIMNKSQKYFVAEQNYLGEINGHVEEMYSGHNVIRVYNAEKDVISAFDSINEKLYISNWKSQFLSGLMMPIMHFVGNFGYVSVCILGAILAIKGSISFGVIVAFMLYIRLFTNPLSQIAQVTTELQSTAAAAERVFEFLEEKELEDESHKEKYLSTVKGEIEFEHVKFGYEGTNKIVIHDFSEHVLPGQKIAIVGPTGAGKTTMVNLLMRFHEINDGAIKIDGVPISELTRENIHALFGMVLQDTWVFEGTIRENIAYSKKNVSDEELNRVCETVGLSHFIKTLPNGYDTIISDKITLSAGQKQLITIARAMIEDAPMLILDEATSSVDTRTEALIQSAMDKLTKGRTSFVIAHRLSTIKNADKILVMKDGDIIESGNHETLLKQNGFYASLYNSQFESSAS